VLRMVQIGDSSPDADHFGATNGVYSIVLPTRGAATSRIVRTKIGVAERSCRATPRNGVYEIKAYCRMAHPGAWRRNPVSAGTRSSYPSTTRTSENAQARRHEGAAGRPPTRGLASGRLPYLRNAPTRADKAQTMPATSVT
jgi:hypothetical protein